MTKLNVSYVPHSDAERVIAHISVFTSDLRTVNIFYNYDLCFDEGDNNTRDVTIIRASLAETKERVADIVKILEEHLKKYRALEKECKASDQTDVEL